MSESESLYLSITGKILELAMKLKELNHLCTRYDETIRMENQLNDMSPRSHDKFIFTTLKVIKDRYFRLSELITTKRTWTQNYIDAKRIEQQTGQRKSGRPWGSTRSFKEE